MSSEIFYYGMDGQPISVTEWGRLVSSPEKIVARTDLPGGIWVSTVLLGVDHSFGTGGPPIIFESMTFKGWSMEDEFWSRVDRSGEADECWPWLGYVAANGYGRVYRDGVQQQAHRVAWELFNFEDVPDDLVVHHECRNRVCCNPAHLRVVTNRENLMVDDTPAHRNSEKTHCPHGHEYTPENTRYVQRKQGRSRLCVECGRKDARERYRRKVRKAPEECDMAELDCRRYATREQAEAGHSELVTRWTGWTMGDPMPEDRELSPLSALLEAMRDPWPDAMVVMYPKDAQHVADPDSKEETDEQ